MSLVEKYKEWLQKDSWADLNNINQIPFFLNEYLNTTSFQRHWHLSTGYVISFNRDDICSLNYFKGDFESLIEKCIILYKLDLLK